jgi:prephenate dehydratase
MSPTRRYPTVRCRHFLEQHDWELVSVSDTAAAERRVAGGRNNENAALASLVAAKEYGLKLVAENIEINPRNYTRFVIIGKSPLYTGSIDKTSLICSTRSEPSLFKVARWSCAYFFFDSWHTNRYSDTDASGFHHLSSS